MRFFEILKVDYLSPQMLPLSEKNSVCLYFDSLQLSFCSKLWYVSIREIKFPKIPLKMKVK